MFSLFSKAYITLLHLKLKNKIHFFSRSIYAFIFRKGNRKASSRIVKHGFYSWTFVRHLTPTFPKAWQIAYPYIYIYIYNISSKHCDL